MTVPDSNDPSWIGASQALLAVLNVPRSITWIKRWVKEHPTQCGDYLNTLSYLSMKGLVTPCYDSSETPHWVVINNVPYGWLTYRTQPEKKVRGPKKKKKEAAVENETEPAPEPESAPEETVSDYEAKTSVAR